MALPAPRLIFGVHSMTPYNRTTGEFYGILKVLGGSSVSLSGETVDLMGGSSKYAWGSEDGPIESEMSLKPKEYPNFLFELFLGKAPTQNSAETTGNVSTITDKYGTTVVGSVGIASVSALSGSEANLKNGKYVVKAASATTVDVYYSSDLDLARGTNGTYQDGTLKITASPLTITAASDTNVTDFGFKFTGGAGPIAMTTGETATFHVRPVNSGSMEVRIGSSSDSIFPEFGSIVAAQKRGNQEMVTIELFRCKGIGLPLGFEENAWSEAEIKAKLLYDSAEDAVFRFLHVQPSNT